MNVDTGQFKAICDQVADIGYDVGDLETHVALNEAHLALTADLLSRLLRDLLPAVRHAAHLTRQPGPRGRHRAGGGAQRRGSGRHNASHLPHCGEIS